MQGAAVPPPILKLCTAQRFLADVSYQKCNKNDFNTGLAPPSIIIVVKEVSNII